MNLQKIVNFIMRQQPTAIKLHRTLVRLQAINPEHGGQGEELKARWIEEWLLNNGLCHIQRFDSLDERVPLGLRPNLVVHYNPTRSDKTLWVVCHMDTVAAGELSLWQSDPFTLRIDGDFLYGRGVEDSNQAIVSMLILFDALKTTQIKPPMGLGMICVSAGLTDHTKGISYVLEKNPNLFSTNDFIVVLDYGNAEGSYIQLAEKKSAWLKVSIEGQEDHAGYEINSNPFEAGALLISEIKRKFNTLNQQNPSFSPPVSTIAPTHCETSCTGLNHIPNRFTFYLDIRLNPEYSLESVMKRLMFITNKIEKNEKVKIICDFVEITPDVPATPEDAPVVVALKKALKTSLNVTPICVGVGGATLVSILRSTYLPVAVWSIQSSPKVRANERLSISGQINQTKVLANLLFSSSSENKTAKTKVKRKYTRRTVAKPLKKSKITDTEYNVSKLIGDGIKNDDIAIHLNISKNTVRTHIKSLYKKTGCQNRTELKAWYKKEQLLATPDNSSSEK